MVYIVECLDRQASGQCGALEVSTKDFIDYKGMLIYLEVQLQSAKACVVTACSLSEVIQFECNSMHSQQFCFTEVVMLFPFC